MHTIAQARREVETLSADIINFIATGAPARLHDIERQLWPRLLAFGRALLSLYFARQFARPRPAECIVDGVRYVESGEIRERKIGTLFGKMMLPSPLARRPENLRARADRPLERALGLCGGFSRTVVLGVARLAAMMPYATARSWWRETYGWSPSPKAVERMIDRVGQEAAPFLEDAPPPEDDGEVLVIEVDAGGAPMIGDAEYERRCGPRDAPTGEMTERHRRRERRQSRPVKERRKGKKSKNAKMAFVVAMYTLRQTGHGLEGPCNKRLWATFESHEAAFEAARVEAIKRGSEHKRLMFLADGSEHIWQRQARFFPDAVVCLDWWHVVEHVWRASTCFHDEGTAAQVAWVDAQKVRLRDDRVDDVIAELRAKRDATAKTGPGNKGRRENLARIADYFARNRERMMYGALRASDLDIGTGVIEGAVRNLVRMRFDGPGMRWGRGRAEKLLHLRCILLNGQWDDFAEAMYAPDELTLRPQPEPARPHTAVPLREAA